MRTYFDVYSWGLWPVVLGALTLKHWVSLTAMDSSFGRHTYEKVKCHLQN